MSQPKKKSQISKYEIVSDPLHFAGSHEAPSKLSEVFSRRPILGRGKPTKKLAELAERRSIFVKTKGRTKPKIEITRIEDSRSPLWRIDVPRSKTQTLAVLPGRTARREGAEYFNEIDRSIPTCGFRPSWADVMFCPRQVPSRGLDYMDRFNGGGVEPLYVFGHDNRRAFQDASWPWGLVGKIFSNDGSIGTGALVGDRLVITAGHNVPWPDDPWWMRFVPAYFDGESLFGPGVESNVSDVRGRDTGGKGAGYDWAILRLYEPLGHMLGYFGYNGYSSDWNKTPYWSTIGYPGAIAGGLRPSFQNGITIRDVDGDSHGGKELESRTADVTKGNSGGPLFGWWGNDPRIVGVVTGEGKDFEPLSVYGPWVIANVFASGSGFTKLIAWGRSHWPA